jgi:hypothetical protein
MIGGTVREEGLPVWLGEIIAFVLRSTGPTGINFARYSIDYHVLRNYLHVLGEMATRASSEPVAAARQALPLYARRIVDHYMETSKSLAEIEAKIASGRAPSLPRLVERRREINVTKD